MHSGGIFSVALMSDYSAWALPSTSPFGVRTFLSQENPASGHPAHSNHLVHSSTANRESKHNPSGGHLLIGFTFELIGHVQNPAAIGAIE